ncbi:MAG: hypothetical protein JNL01_09990 [Bdellovibrionales bacterium]|nr:hypothetical protein [Bdellovibrionales bacterium]
MKRTLFVLLVYSSLGSWSRAADAPAPAPAVPITEDLVADPLDTPSAPLAAPEPAAPIEEPPALAADPVPAAREVPRVEIKKDPEPEPPVSEVVESAPLPTATTSGRTNLSTWEFDPDVPLIQRIRPQWGIRIEGSSSAWKGLPNSSIRQIGMGFEFQPRVFQKVGVLGLGVGFGILPVVSSGMTLNTTHVSSIGSLWYLAGTLRYQLKIVRNQWVVPMAAFHFERATYKTKTLASGATTASGLSLGALFLLNAVDPEIAAQSLAEAGLVRSYLFAEFRMLRPTGGALSYEDRALIAGIRLEYE